MQIDVVLDKEEKTRNANYGEQQFIENISTIYVMKKKGVKKYKRITSIKYV